MQIQHPYLLFLGDAADQLAAKTSIGVAQWRPEWCLGQLRLPGCRADAGVRDLTVPEATRAGAKTMIVGVVNRGGVISQAWLDVLLEALAHGLDLASGLHDRLSAIPALAEAAHRHGRRLFDVRHPDRSFPIASG